MEKSIESLKSTAQMKEKTIQSMTAQLEEFIGKFNSTMNVNESLEKALKESKHQCERGYVKACFGNFA
jgi:cysteine sulfinate desulfinase/cysteine desulfurase-like protein